MLSLCAHSAFCCTLETGDKDFKKSGDTTAHLGSLKKKNLPLKTRRWIVNLQASSQNLPLSPDVHWWIPVSTLWASPVSWKQKTTGFAASVCPWLSEDLSWSVQAALLGNWLYHRRIRWYQPWMDAAASLLLIHPSACWSGLYRSVSWDDERLDADCH